MNRHRLWLAGLVLLGFGAAVGAGAMYSAQGPGPAAEGQPPPIPGQPAQAAPAANPVDAGVRQATQDYVKAFNAHDAKAAAAQWTNHCEYVGVDGTPIQGRAALEKSFADEFKAFPKINIQVKVSNVRPVGQHTAMVEGTVTVKTLPEGETVETRFSALQVFEDGTWKAASVREWIANPDMNAAMRLLDFLVGEWTAKGHGGTMNIRYAWNESKTFVTGKYAVTKDGKTTQSGTEVLTRDPNGGLRSWTFDDNGTFSWALWQREDNRWFDDATGILPDGTQLISANLLVPLGADAFSWQVMERSADGEPLPPLPPVKMTRVKPGK